MPTDPSWAARNGVVSLEVVAQQQGAPVVLPWGVSAPVDGLPLAPGYFRLTTILGPRSSADYCLAGEARIVTDRSVGGWDVIERRGRVGLTVWGGGAPLLLEVPFTMDALAVRGGDVGPGYRRLLELWNPGGGDAPPVLRIAGHVPGTAHKWVLDALDFDEDTIRLGSRLVRQSGTLRLLQFVDVDVAKRAGKGAAGKARRDVPRVVKVTGALDTLRKLARHYLGSGRRWRDIAKLNKGLRSPDRKLKVGADIRIPPDPNRRSRYRMDGGA